MTFTATPLVIRLFLNARTHLLLTPRTRFTWPPPAPRQKSLQVPVLTLTGTSLWTLTLQLLNRHIPLGPPASRSTDCTFRLSRTRVLTQHLSVLLGNFNVRPVLSALTFLLRRWQVPSPPIRLTFCFLRCTHSSMFELRLVTTSTVVLNRRL